MAQEAIYSDSLVELAGGHILFKTPFYPFGGRKTVPLKAVDRVIYCKPGFRSGKYRYQGSGDLRTWFTMDWRRHRRDRIFILFFRERWIRLGFTVEDSATFTGALRGQGVKVVEYQK